MFLFIFGLLVAFVALACIIYGVFVPKTVHRVEKGRYGDGDKEFDDPSNKGLWIAGGFIALVIGGIMVAASAWYSQPVGDGKVITVAGKVTSTDITSGGSWKSPWAQMHNWDLINQKLTFVGNADEGTPEYAGGTISGYEVTASVKGGSQANIDVIVLYSVDGTKIADLHNEFRSQTTFTQNVVVPRVLSIIRQVPSAYTPIEFRGEKRGEAQQTIEERLAEELSPYGITVTSVDIQKIAYRQNVEDSIQAVEAAQQLKATAEAEQEKAIIDAETALVKAQGEANAAVAAAQGQADANALLASSLTPQILEQRRIDAMKAGTVYVVPQGSTPLVSVP